MEHFLVKQWNTNTEILKASQSVFKGTKVGIKRQLENGIQFSKYW